MTLTALAHEPFCTPRPGLDEPRVETFNTTSRDDGVVVRVTRCVECGVTTYLPLGRL